MKVVEIKNKLMIPLILVSLLIIILVVILIVMKLYPSNSDNTSTVNNSDFYKTAVIYKDDYLTGIDFPVGALGGSVIRMNGKAERAWWQIFNNYEERLDSGIVPNSFFAIRTNAGASTEVRALQTSTVDSFPAMESLTFQGEYPFGQYNFTDKNLPVNVKMEAYNPLIPMDLKNSAIPSSIYRITVKNTSKKDVTVSLLGSQQNAVGFDGYGKIAGENKRNYKAYGNNVNEITSDSTSTSLKMTGTAGSMQLTAYETGMSHTASWNSISELFNDFKEDGSIIGETLANSPLAGVTVDGAIAKEFILKAGEEKTVTFVLSWYIPNGTFGRKDIPKWSNFKGQQYENWWADASDVDNYVKTNFDALDYMTRLFHNTLYSSNIPKYAIDRISSNLCVLKSPTVFWAKNGYFGMWESTSNKEEWFGNCKHVYHYAQAIARVYPELARTVMTQNLNTQTKAGLLPSRDGELGNALDGHLGTILGIYREHLLTDDNTWLNEVWGKTKIAMDHIIKTYDKDNDGMFIGIYANTLDGSTLGTNPWIGSMYLASLKACANMAEIVGDIESRDNYTSIFTTGSSNQDTQLWDNNLNYYIEKSQNSPLANNLGNGCSIDMLLGQWWSNQLDLGQIYPKDRTIKALSQIYVNNKFTDTGSDFKYKFRDFLGKGDTGWMMVKFPGELSKKPVSYYDEAMSGFEYSFAATLLQYGMNEEGLNIVNSISKRYDGRFRGSKEVTTASNATVFGTGSPFGEDECGDFYGRALSSWSILTAMQGYSYDGPKQSIGFKPTWQPNDHSSFFTTSNAWGLFTQSQSNKEQISKIEVRYGNTSIKNIVLLTPNQKTAVKIKVMLDGVDQQILINIQSENTLTINLNSTIIVNAGSNLTVTFNY